MIEDSRNRKVGEGRNEKNEWEKEEGDGANYGSTKKIETGGMVKLNTEYRMMMKYGFVSVNIG